jgi:hypothetical protein
MARPKLAWAAAVFAGTATLAASACPRPELEDDVPVPPVAAEDVNVIMTGPEGIWPGGLARLPDGSFYIAYQRNDPRATAFGRVVPDLLEPPGPEEHVAGFFVSDDDALRAFDPGVAVTAAGDTIVSWANTALGVFLHERRPDGTFTAAVELAPSHYTEATMTNALGRTFVIYNHVPPGDAFGRHFQNDVLVQEISGLTEHDPAVKAGGPAGSGTEGNQFRATLAETGRPEELIVVWNRPSTPPGGDRTIWGAISPDRGETWGIPFLVAQVPGDDLVNPFVINVRFAGELRVYFVNLRAGKSAELNMVASSDRGTSWGAAQPVPRPAGARRSPARPVFIEVDGRLVCFGSWNVDGIPTLGTYVVP